MAVPSSKAIRTPFRRVSNSPSANPKRKIYNYSPWVDVNGVILATDTAQVQHAVRTLSRHRIPFVPRGAGTGLSGGAVALDDAWIIDVSRTGRRVFDVVKEMESVAWNRLGLTFGGAPDIKWMEATRNTEYNSVGFRSHSYPTR